MSAGHRIDRVETAELGRHKTKDILSSAKAWKKAQKNLLVKPVSTVPSTTVLEDSDSEDSGFEDGEVGAISTVLYCCWYAWTLL